jgi:type I restriction enzyme S subunit
MNVLLSIKPEYAQKIATKVKRYEFRKTIFKTKVSRIYIYSSSPIKKIIGFFIVDNIIEDNPSNLWGKFNKHSGIEEEEFFKYFENKQKGYAIKIGALELFHNPVDPYKELPNFIPPQSFCYFSELE